MGTDPTPEVPERVRCFLTESLPPVDDESNGDDVISGLPAQRACFSPLFLFSESLRRDGFRPVPGHLVKRACCASRSRA
jgi:hypothetical protein